ncbi:YybH family protein [Kribbella sp. NPDC050124]|uniref:YybH family protein n=1 Tax=Kribbella sp. NPDC050124 TaxID=3364114 RepID=UPI0037AC10C9
MREFTADEQAILQLHKDWWESNNGLDVPRMRQVFPTGDAYLMFNLNGHPYFGIEEKTNLWQWYRGRIEITAPLVKIMRLDVVGDLAYIAAEGVFPSRQLRQADDSGEVLLIGESEQSFPPEIRMRATEVYKRDDGTGELRWTMWHFHCSPLPPADEPRPSVGDTSEQRGLGAVPGHEIFGVVG